MKYSLRIIFISLSIYLIAVFSSASVTFAQTKDNPNSDPNDPGGQSVNTINIGNQLSNSKLGIQSQNSQGVVGTILKNVLVLFFTVGGIGATIYFIWGAVDWILSGGDKEKVSNARKKMTQALIGLALLALSFVIIRVVGEVIGFNPLGPVQIRRLDE
jgi:hypothetical protein